MLANEASGCSSNYKAIFLNAQTRIININKMDLTSRPIYLWK